jgi:hypothetical protein
MEVIMGLDMYAWGVDAELADRFLESKMEPNFKPDELHYWRKHHDLHGWMESRYYAGGGAAKSFNCVKLRLTLEMLDDLERDIKAKRLPATEGFFFGNNPPDEESNFDDLNFIAKARTYINGGGAVFYDSWW